MYRVKLTAAAAETLNRLHPDLKTQIKSILKTLYDAPYSGKALQGDLGGLRSLKMKRYRAIYQVDDHNLTITVHAIGHRRDIYDIISALMVDF